MGLCHGGQMLIKFILSLIMSVLLLSCSGLVESTRKNLLGSEAPRKNAKKEVKWVSKNQYDDLMVKYKSLNDKYEGLKEQKLTAGSQIDQLDKIDTDLQKKISKFRNDEAHHKETGN